ncbi:TPR and ankyrin repeat-containing protein 1 isoform X2 [Anas acuta]|uniref:TPR and ankyrin repeat-containing protein 1 isoform X2 n=1 Tax=Anas acuta TaxID=28680 RepID=UPI0035C93C7C
MSFSMDAMQYAQFMKKAGNEDFKNGSYSLAIRKYDQALHMLIQIRQRILCSEDIAVLYCNKSTALYNLGKWREAMCSAFESLRWNPEYVKAYYRAGHSLIMLSNSFEAISMFHKGLILLNASVDQSQVADFIAGIFTSVNDERVFPPTFHPAYDYIFSVRFNALIWQAVMEKLAQKGKWRSFLLLLSKKKELPTNLRVNQLSLKNLLETFESYGCDGKMQDVAELVKWLISIGAKVETIGVYPLHAVIRLCIKARRNHIFRWLLTQKPDLRDTINQQDRDGCTLLHIVASSSEYSRKHSQTEDVLMLLSFGVDPTIPDARSRYVIDILKKNKNFNAVKAVRDHTEKHTSSSVELEEDKSRAVVDSFLDALEQFVKFCSCENGIHNTNVLKKDEVQGFLKLLSSVKEIPKGAVCNISQACANSFIKQLLKKQMWHEVLLLLTGKASGEETLGGGLFKTCSLSDVDIGSVIQQCDGLDEQIYLIRCLIENGALPDGIGANSEIPLQICLEKNYFELVHLLLIKGADPKNISIAQGDTPLHAAVYIYFDKKDGIGLNILNYLLDLFASRPSDFPYLNPNIQDKNGDTVMHVIFQRGFLKQTKKIMDSLAKFDINFNIKNKLGRDVRHRIKKNDPLLLAWKTAVSEKKYRQNIAGQSVKTPKSAPVSDISQTKSSGHSSSGSLLKAPSGNTTHNDVKTSCSVKTKNDQFVKQEMEKIKNPLTLQESLVQEIRALIQQLKLGDTLRNNNSLLQKPFSAQTTMEEGKKESSQPCGNVINPEGKGDDWKKKMETQEFSMDLSNGEKEEPEEEEGDILDIEAHVQEFDNMTWEIECTPETLKTLSSKAVPPYLKTKTIMTIKHLGNGEWTKVLQKPLKHLKADIQLYEAKLGKGARMLWELAIDFSPRCSESAEKIMETEQTKGLPEKSGRVYTEIIRIWAIVLDHCKLKRVLDNICISYNRGLSCILRKKLKGINKGHQSYNKTVKKHVPRCYIEDLEAEKSKEHTFPEYFPPASAAEMEYNIMKFHSFSTNMAFNIINDVHFAVEYPFRVGELEHAVINLNPKPIEPIILIGRSGTGKTTCCLYRLWKKFYLYWERSTMANSPLLVRQTWQQKQCSEAEKVRLEKEEHGEKQDSDDSSEEQVSDVQGSEDEKVPVDTTGGETNLCDDHEDHVCSAETLNSLEHLHQIFVTKNPVLCQEVQKNFIELSKSSKITSHFRPLEPSVHRLQDIKDENFPLFVTSKQLLLLLDASMPDPFFPRNEDGSLKRTIVGWSPQEELVVPNWQDENEEGNAEVEHGDEEGAADAHSRESDPRTFVTYDVFANEIWPKMVKGKSLYNPALVWKEIKSFLKGSFEALNCTGGKLTEEGYKKLGLKRSPNFTEDRSEIYRLFDLYQQIRSQRSYFDEEDLLYNLSQRLSKLSELPWSIHEFYGDEIQDFTQAELVLLMKCINDPNAMFLTGDTAQSIMKGVAFRFSDLRSLFHYASKNSIDKKQRVRKPKRIYQLYQNYRSHSGILRLASGVVDLLQCYFPESFDRLPKDCGLFDGPKPTVLESCSFSDLAILLRGNKRKTQPIEFGAHQVILVANETAKEKIPKELSLALVLTVYEAKGLEFDDVLLYNFFTDSEAGKEWKIISSYVPDSDMQVGSKLLIEVPLEDATDLQKRPSPFNVKMYKMLNGELKQLYTAITRARVNLWIFDENSEKRAPAFKYFIKRGLVQVVKTDENKDLDDSMFAKTSSPEEWIAQGDYYAKHQFWEVAAKCYQKGGASEKSKLALAHDAVLKVHLKKSSPREKQMEYMTLAKTYLECGEPKLSLKCLLQSKEFRLCAELCKKLGKMKEAAVYYQKIQCYKEASECYEQIEEFGLAIKMYCQEELYEEAAKAVERYEEILNTRGQMVSNLPCTASQLYLEAAAKYLSMNKTEEMMRVLSKLDIEDQLEFLKSRGCLRQTADLLKREGRQEEAAKLMKQHGFAREAANLTTIKEFRASCLLAAARADMTHCSELDMADREGMLREALELCEETKQKSGVAEAVFLQGALKGDFAKLSRAYCQFLSLNHSAGAVEVLFVLSRCNAQSQNILFKATHGLIALLGLVKSLKKAATNAEKDMVKSCFAYFGIVPTGDSCCQVSQNEGEPILKFLSDKLSLKERKTKGNFSVSTEDVKSALKQHLLSRLCSIIRELRKKHYPGICSKFIVGLNCEDETCKDLHKPLLRREARTVFQCKMHLAAINGLLLEATRTFPEELLSQCKSFDFLTPDKYASCKALLEMFFPNHFHLRILSENPNACKEIMVFSNIVSKPCRAVLNEYITFKFQNEDARARRESSDLWLSAMKVFLLSSGYPEEFEKLLFEEEDYYNRELNLALSKAKDSPKCKHHRGEIKGIDGRHGMLLPDKYTENTGTHLCFIRLLENSFEQFYVHKNPENCKRLFFRFMNVLVKKCTRFLIPSIGNTVMMLEFQYILCCAVLMRLNKNITLCFPKSYIALIHYWDFLFRSKDYNKEFTETFSIIQEYRPKDIYTAEQDFKFHLCYLAKILCGVHGRFRVVLDAFEDPECITSGEAERTIVLCLVMILNADQVQNSTCKYLLYQHFPEIKKMLESMRKDFPSKVPKRLLKVVEQVAGAKHVREIAEGLKELLTERDEEYLVDCRWKWDSVYAQGRPPTRGILYETVNLDRFITSLDKTEYADEIEKELESNQCLDDQKDPLEVIALRKQQKQEQKASAQRQLHRVFHFVSMYMKWKRKACSKAEPVAMGRENFLSAVFRKADIDQTQCDLCGVRFIQSAENYFSQTENMEADAPGSVTPTDISGEEKLQVERNAVIVASEAYIEHRNTDEHKNNNTAYRNYADFFRREIDPKIQDGLEIVEAITEKACTQEHLAYKEGPKLHQRKIKENIKMISDAVEEIYERKAWAEAEEIITKRANKLFAVIDEAHKWLKKMDLHRIKEDFVHDRDFEDEVEDERMAFEELAWKKISRKKGRYGKL